MKLYLSSALVASILAGAMAIVAHSPGIHSTPGFWLMVANLPGTVIGVWFGMWLGSELVNGPIFYLLVAAANWAAYVSAAKIFLLVRHRYS